MGEIFVTHATKIEMIIKETLKLQSILLQPNEVSDKYKRL
jgi:hypothetical protein